MSKSILSRTKNQGAPRLGFNAYNISRERYVELRNGCAVGIYSPEMLQEACRGFEFAKPWILLSVTKRCSFDRLEAMASLGKVERIPCGKSDFYGYRRRFFYNLDCLLMEEQKNASVKERGKG